MKCPCENCITLSMCKNLYPHSKTGNVMHAITKCSLLYDYINVKKINTPTNEIWSDLEHEILTERMDILHEFLPWKEEKK